MYFTCQNSNLIKLFWICHKIKIIETANYFFDQYILRKVDKKF